MQNLTDGYLFERLEHKIVKDSKNSWHQPEHPSRKQVVILAGPQLSEMSLAHQFFIHHASRYRPNQRSSSLSGWVWPWIDPDNVLKKFIHPTVPRDRLFDLLIEYEDNEALVQLILTEIERSWTQDAYKGIILGSEYFDQIPDATRLIQRILDRLGVTDPKQVTIVLNYPSSRVTQWNAFFSLATQNTPMSYHDYICNPKFESSSLQRLMTSTNPVGLAREFKYHEWAVALIDMQGLATAQQDLAHVIACQLLAGTSCERGHVVGIPVHPTTISSAEPLVTELNALQQEELETYFADRDCYYQDDLMRDGPRFDALFRTNLWSSCASDQSLEIYYEQLAAPMYLWSLLRSQVSCPIDNESTNNTDQVLQQNISRVEGSMPQPTADDGTMIKVVTIPVVCSLLALLFIAIRYHKVRQDKPMHSDVLRMWDQSDELEPDFSQATLSNTILSKTHPTIDANYNDNEKSEMPSSQQINLISESQDSRGILT